MPMTSTITFLIHIYPNLPSEIHPASVERAPKHSPTDPGAVLFGARFVRRRFRSPPHAVAMAKSKKKMKSDASRESFKKSAASSNKSSECVRSAMGSKPSSNETEDGMLKIMAKALTHNSWFHGLMPREEIEDCLKNEGDFLMRKTEVERKPRYAVSVCRKGAIKHILLNYKNGMWMLREVFIGVWKKSKDEQIDVAVKKLRGQMLKSQRAELVKESRIMKRFKHENIVIVHGICPQEEPLMIVLELAPGGSLLGKLKNCPELTSDQLLGFCRDAARGMCYLASRQVIHRDIAARNCLLGKNNELKISDFGLSIADFSLVKVDKLKNMPIKWLAPETLRKGEFSKKTDVWAYGILIYEIFSRGTDPFPGESNHQAKDKILEGKMMKAPPGAHPIAATIMEMCFIMLTDMSNYHHPFPDPKERPEFDGLFKILAPNEKPPVNQDNMFETYAT
uniref:Tyrosine-protein kinase n=1 Tax=Panagrellus redivivus TaxID=6233 RepID=A0A7E4W4C9_PANRE